MGEGWFFLLGMCLLNVRVNGCICRFMDCVCMCVRAFMRRVCMWDDWLSLMQSVPLQALGDCLSPAVYNRGQALFHTGDEATCMYFIMDGDVRIRCLLFRRLFVVPFSFACGRRRAYSLSLLRHTQIHTHTHSLSLSLSLSFHHTTFVCLRNFGLHTQHSRTHDAHSTGHTDKQTPTTHTHTHTHTRTHTHTHNDSYWTGVSRGLCVWVRVRCVCVCVSVAVWLCGCVSRPNCRAHTGVCAGQERTGNPERRSWIVLR